MDEEAIKANIDDDGDAAVLGAGAEERAIAAEHKFEDVPADIAGRVGRTRVVGNREESVEVEAGGEAKGEWSPRVSERSSSSRRTRSSSSSSSSESEGEYPAWRLALRRLASSEKFQRSVTVLIVFNTLILALDHHPMDEEFSTVLEACNLAFTLCFALEMIIKVRRVFAYIIYGVPLPF